MLTQVLKQFLVPLQVFQVVILMNGVGIIKNLLVMDLVTAQMENISHILMIPNLPRLVQVQEAPL